MWCGVQVFGHQWIAGYNKVPATPLYMAADFLGGDEQREVQEEMTNHLNTVSLPPPSILRLPLLYSTLLHPLSLSSLLYSTYYCT